MKKQIVYGLVVGMLVGTGAIAHAQVAPIPAPAVMSAPILAPATTTTAPISAKAAKKAKLQEAVTKMEHSLQVRIANLDDLAVRVQTRIGKMQQEGKDVTVANAKLVEAQKAIALAKAEMEKLKKANASMVASAKPTVGFANVKNKLVKNVTVKIKAAHKALVDTIVIMKGQGTPGTVPSTATSSTSTIR
jgi:hypothetical protein